MSVLLSRVEKARSRVANRGVVVDSHATLRRVRPIVTNRVPRLPDRRTAGSPATHSRAAHTRRERGVDTGPVGRRDAPLTAEVVEFRDRGNGKKRRRVTGCLTRCGER